MLFMKVYFKNHLHDDSSFPEASNVYQEIYILKEHSETYSAYIELKSGYPVVREKSGKFQTR